MEVELTVNSPPGTEDLIETEIQALFAKPNIPYKTSLKGKTSIAFTTNSGDEEAIGELEEYGQIELQKKKAETTSA